MTQTLHSEADSRKSRLDALTDALSNTRVVIPVVVLVLVATLAFFAYAVRSYLGADCYKSLHEAELDTEIEVLFDSVDETLVGLRKGTGYTSKWTNSEFQDALKAARHVLADGRENLKNRQPFGAFNAVVDLERSVAKAKSLATNRVNFILEHQNPADYDAFEKYRLEGKNLVAIVKDLDSVLETLDGRTKKLPGTCNW